MQYPVEVSSQQISALHRILADERCKRVVDVLEEIEVPIALADVAREVRAKRESKPVSEVTAQEATRERTALYHEAIPRLEDVGLVACNPDHGTVKLIDSPLLEAFQELRG